ncbi:MAG: BMC domain-containing protein, partial [Pirellula sp.]
MASSLTDRSHWGSENQNGFPSIGILETNGWTSGMVACDAMAKSANVSVIQAEW